MSDVKSLQKELIGLSPNTFAQSLKLSTVTRDKLVEALERLEQLETTSREATAILETGVSLLESIEHLNTAVDSLQAGQKWLQNELANLSRNLESASSDGEGNLFAMLQSIVGTLDSFGERLNALEKRAYPEE